MTSRRDTLRGVLRSVQALIIFTICSVLCRLEAEASPVVTNFGAKRCVYLLTNNTDTMGISNPAESKPTIRHGRGIEHVSLRYASKNNLRLRTDGRSKRYAVKEEIWPTKNLTYKISSYPSKLEEIIVDKEIAKAFALWSEHTDLTFTPKIGTVDIEIKFVRRDHGDGEPFAERIPGAKQSHKVAHIFSSTDGTGVEVHFDEDVEWSINNNRGKSLLVAAAHVFGHALGLGHSTNKPSIMYPWNIGMHYVKLYYDDIVKIQALYGPKTPEEDPDLCKDSTFDTIFNSAEGDTYVFKGHHYWKLTVDGDVAPGYPRLIATKWKALPGNIDAAFTDENGKTYFFKGSIYWMYFGDQMDQDSPRYINENFHGIPDDIDAATVMYETGRIWFAKDGKYWIFDLTQVPHIHSQYPKSISDLQGIPDKVNAVLNQQNVITFFEGERFYRHDKRTIRWVLTNPEFNGPRLFGCPSKKNSIFGRITNVVFGSLNSGANLAKSMITTAGKKLDF